MKRETMAERDARRADAYERGWKDGLRGYWDPNSRPGHGGDYSKGWGACAEYRWADRANNGVAPDPNFRSANPFL